MKTLGRENKKHLPTPQDVFLIIGKVERGNVQRNRGPLRLPLRKTLVEEKAKFIVAEVMISTARGTKRWEAHETHLGVTFRYNVEAP